MSGIFPGTCQHGNAGVCFEVRCDAREAARAAAREAAFGPARLTTGDAPPFRFASAVGKTEDPPPAPAPPDTPLERAKTALLDTLCCHCCRDAQAPEAETILRRFLAEATVIPPGPRLSQADWTFKGVRVHELTREELILAVEMLATLELRTRTAVPQ